MKFWVFPARPDPAEALRAWLEARLKAAPDPTRSPDLAHEPVILIWPPDRLGEVVWDPQMAPPAKPEHPAVRPRAAKGRLRPSHPPSEFISDVLERAAEPEGSTRGSIPTAYWSFCKEPRQKRHDLRRFCRAL